MMFFDSRWTGDVLQTLVHPLQPSAFFSPRLLRSGIALPTNSWFVILFALLDARFVFDVAPAVTGYVCMFITGCRLLSLTLTIVLLSLLQVAESRAGGRPVLR